MIVITVCNTLMNPPKILGNVMYTTKKEAIKTRRPPNHKKALIIGVKSITGPKPKNCRVYEPGEAGYPACVQHAPNFRIPQEDVLTGINPAISPAAISIAIRKIIANIK